jgi:hypothetical protein
MELGSICRSSIVLANMEVAIMRFIPRVSMVLFACFTVPFVLVMPAFGLQYYPQDYPPDTNCFDHPPENLSVKIMVTVHGFTGISEGAGWPRR